jgi:predicted DNA-binding protein with PD1-like motif
MKGKKLGIRQMWFLRIDPGEEIVSSIQKFSEENKIKSGFVSFIGAVKNAKIIVPGNAQKVQPIVKDFPIKSELVGVGSITMKEGKPFAHLHFMKSDDTYAVQGGHLVSGEVIITCEVVIIEGSDAVERVFDPKINLHKFAL